MKTIAPITCALGALALWCLPQPALAQAQRAEAARAQLLHQILPDGEAHISATPAQRMTTRYTGEEVRWRFARDASAPAELVLRPTRWGRAGQLRALDAPTRQRSRGDALELERGAVKEWYVNRPEGVEQSFLLRERPKGSGPVEVRMRVGGTLTPTLTDRGATLRLSDGPREVARYTKLIAFDANRRPLPARMVLRGRELALQVEDARAAYPITIDPLVLRPGNELIPNGTVNNGQFGFAVALYDPEPGGGTPAAAVSAPGAGNGTDRRGRVYLFELQNGMWKLVKTLDAPASILAADANARFGAALAMDDSVLVVGAPGADAFGKTDAGRVFVYERPTSGWAVVNDAPAQSLDLTTPNDGAGLGASVALHYDLIAIGAPGTNEAFVSHRIDNPFGWSSPISLSTTGASVNTSSDFGRAVSVVEAPIEAGATGGILLVGAPGHTQTGTRSGAVFIYTCDDIFANTPIWSRKGTLAHNAPAGAEFGHAIAAFADGGGAIRWAVGAPGGNHGEVTVYNAFPLAPADLSMIFRDTDPSLTNNASNTARFGQSVAIYGGSLLVGAPGSGNDGKGAVFLFEEEIAGTWIERIRMDQFSLRPNAQFGHGVAIGEVSALGGAPFNEINGVSSAGTAHLMELYDGAIPGDTITITSPVGHEVYPSGASILIEGTADASVPNVQLTLHHVTPEGHVINVSLPGGGLVTPDPQGKWQLNVNLTAGGATPPGMYEVVAMAPGSQFGTPPARFILGADNALAVMSPISNSFFDANFQLVVGLAHPNAQVTLIFKDRAGNEIQRSVGGQDPGWTSWPPGHNVDAFLWEYAITPTLAPGQWQLEAIATLSGFAQTTVGPITFTVEGTPSTGIVIASPQPNARITVPPLTVSGSAPVDAGDVQLSLRPQGSTSATPLWYMRVTPNNGTWRADVPGDITAQMTPGAYELYADPTGTPVMGAMVAFTVLGGDTPGDRPIDDPDPGEVDPDGNYTTSTPTLRGDAPPGATVEITIDDRAAVTTTANVNGRWSYTIDPPLDDGEHSITIRILDESGAELEASTFKFGVLIPEPPTLERKRCSAAAPGAPLPADALAWLALGAGLALGWRRRR